MTLESAIVSGSALITAISAFIAALKSSQNSSKLTELHILMNSRLEQLLKVSEEKSFAAGVKSETDKEK